MYATYPFAVNELLRFHKGVPAFLDFQVRMNQDAFSALSPLLEPLGKNAQLLLQNVLEIGRSATACEIRVRENERLQLVTKAKLPATLDAYAQELNRHAVKSATRAVNTVRTLDFPDQFAQSFDKAEIKELLSSAREQMVRSLSEFNFTNTGDFEETIEIWDQVALLAQTSGPAGLVKHLEGQLNEFAERRMTEERGTSPASPLPWWKYVVIGLLIAVSIFAVVACFVWFRCTYLSDAISGAAPWLFGVIDRGC